MKMAARVVKKSETASKRSQLSEQHVSLLLVVCTDLVNLCAKITGKIDPSAAAMLAHVRDNIRFKRASELVQ